jgi:multidrug transporter EmrE-like cation transporter
MKAAHDDQLRRRRGAVWLLAYLVAQVLLTVLLKASAMFEGWYWPGMLIGVCMAMLTTWLFMRVFAFYPPHLAQTLGMGLSFVLGQLAIAALMHTWLSGSQLIGIVAIFTGILLVSEPAPEGGSRC